jgi:hypothetical protein
MENMHIFLLDKPIAFTLEPFKYHVVILFENAFHGGGSVWCLDNLPEYPRKAREVLEALKQGPYSDFKTILTEVEGSIDCWVEVINVIDYDAMGKKRRSKDTLLDNSPYSKLLKEIQNVLDNV